MEMEKKEKVACRFGAFEVGGGTTCRSENHTRMMIQRHMIYRLEHDSRQVKSRCPMNRKVIR